MITFDPHTHFRRVTLVGCGGTGAQIARLLARIAYDMRRRGLHTPALRLIDPDVVTEANVGRQLFAPGDVGRPKAEVLGRRFNLALGLDITWVVAPVSAARHLSEGSELVVDATDNHLARRELVGGGHVLLSCGNHHDTGQVTVGNTADAARIRRQLADPTQTRWSHLPNLALLFPSLLEPEPTPAPEPVTCTTAVAAGTQHLLVNDLVAAVAGQVLYTLLHRQPLTHFLTYLSAAPLTVRSLPITAAALRPFLD